MWPRLWIHTWVSDAGNIQHLAIFTNYVHFICQYQDFLPWGEGNAWGKAEGINAQPKGQNILILTDKMHIIGILFLFRRNKSRSAKIYIFSVEI